MVDKAAVAREPRKFLQGKSSGLWDAALSLRENARNLRIAVSYAYKYAETHGLKYKYGNAGCRTTDFLVRDKDSDAPSMQKSIWDETCIFI